MARLLEALIDLKGAVELGVVHRAAPVARATGRFVEEDAHHDDELALEALGQVAQLVRVLDRRGVVVYRRGAANDDETAVEAAHGLRDALARGGDGLIDGRVRGCLVDEARRRHEWTDRADAKVVEVIKA